MTSRFVAFLCVAGAAWSYVPRDPASNLHRTDSSNIQFLVNQNIAAGLRNADGQVWITSDSDPLGAIAAALKTWSAVTSSSARFSAPGNTSALNDASDAKHVIVFSDTSAIRSFLGDAVAITAISYSVPDGAITDTDIIFNPEVHVFHHIRRQHRRPPVFCDARTWPRPRRQSHQCARRRHVPVGARQR